MAIQTDNFLKVIRSERTPINIYTLVGSKKSAVVLYVLTKCVTQCTDARIKFLSISPLINHYGSGTSYEQHNLLGSNLLVPTFVLSLCTNEGFTFS